MKNQHTPLTELQKSLHFPDERIDFTQKKIWLNQLEKHENTSLQSVSVLLAAAVVLLFIAALTIIFLIYSNSLIK